MFNIIVDKNGFKWYKQSNNEYIMNSRPYKTGILVEMYDSSWSYINNEPPKSPAISSPTYFNGMYSRIRSCENILLNELFKNIMHDAVKTIKKKIAGYSFDEIVENMDTVTGEVTSELTYTNKERRFVGCICMYDSNVFEYHKKCDESSTYMNSINMIPVCDIDIVFMFDTRSIGFIIGVC